MKIQCSKCGAIYNIADAKIPAKGAVTRCQKCQNKLVIQAPGKTALNKGELPAKEQSTGRGIDQAKSKANSLSKMAREKVGEYSEKIKKQARKIDEATKLSEKVVGFIKDMISDIQGSGIKGLLQRKYIVAAACFCTLILAVSLLSLGDDVEFTESDLKLWEDAGFSTREAKKWKREGFEHFNAKSWHQSGFNPKEAKSWKAEGYDSTTATRFKKAGLKVEQLSTLSKEDKLIYTFEFAGVAFGMDEETAADKLDKFAATHGLYHHAGVILDKNQIVLVEVSADNGKVNSISYHPLFTDIPFQSWGMDQKAAKAYIKATYGITMNTDDSYDGKKLKISLKGLMISFRLV